jgi:hypothetical protein
LSQEGAKSQLPSFACRQAPPTIGRLRRSNSVIHLADEPEPLAQKYA